jgi:multidrug efflux pump subunit AcrA (membrane-fusion protein)
MVRLAVALSLACFVASSLAADPKADAAKAAAAAREAVQAAAKAADAAAQAAKDAAVKAAAVAKQAEGKDKNVTSLFDGKTLEGWKKTDFAGAGEVKVEKGQLVLEMGQSLTGVTWKDAAKLPKDNYEITLQAMKLKGDDFFCGLTFPVNDSHASFILGGWGGTLVGMSSIDGLDASENETTIYRKFDRDKWYKVRLRVADGKVQGWVDDEQVIDVELKDKKISTRIEVDASRPLGLATYQVSAAYKDIQLKRLK